MSARFVSVVGGDLTNAILALVSTRFSEVIVASEAGAALLLSHCGRKITIDTSADPFVFSYDADAKSPSLMTLLWATLQLEYDAYDKETSKQLLQLALAFHRRTSTVVVTKREFGDAMTSVNQTIESIFRRLEQLEERSTPKQKLGLLPVFEKSSSSSSADPEWVAFGQGKDAHASTDTSFGDTWNGFNV